MSWAYWEPWSKIRTGGHDDIFYHFPRHGAMPMLAEHSCADSVAQAQIEVSDEANNYTNSTMTLGDLPLSLDIQEVLYVCLRTALPVASLADLITVAVED